MSVCNSITFSQIIKPNFVKDLYNEKKKTAVTMLEQCEVVNLKILGSLGSVFKVSLLVSIILATTAVFSSNIPTLFIASKITAIAFAILSIVSLYFIKNYMMTDNSINTCNQAEKEATKMKREIENEERRQKKDFDKDFDKNFNEEHKKIDLGTKKLLSNLKKVESFLSPLWV